MKYHNKDAALANKTENDLVLYTKNFNSFYWAPDYQSVINDIKSSSNSNISEFIFERNPVNFYIDLDISESSYPSEFKDHLKIAREVSERLVSFFSSLKLKSRIIALKSHGLSKGINKKSYHLIVRLSKPIEDEEDDLPVYTTTETCISIVNHLFPELTGKKIVDASVFREGNFRSIYGSKPGEERPLVPSKIGETVFDDIDSFVQYTPGLHSGALIFNESDFRIPINHNKTTIMKKKVTPHDEISKTSKKQSISAVDSDIIAILNELDPKYYSERNFWLQTGYILKCISTLPVWLSFSSKWSSYNENEAVASWNSFKDTGHTIADLRKLIGKEPLSDMQIKNGEKECIDLILQAWKDPVGRFDFDKSLREYIGHAGKEMGKYFSGCPSGCKIFHVINGKGFLMECQSCKNRFPMMPMVIPPTNIALNLTINNTVINNNYGSSRAPAAIHINEKIFNDVSITGSMNRILSGHILVASEFLKENVSGFVYADDKKPMFFYFNGTIWKEDRGNKQLRARLRSLDKFFTQILTFYSELPVSEHNKSILDATNKQIVKFSDPHYLNKVIEGSQDHYHVENFASELDSNKRLLAFDNGVFDLVKNEFRVATMDDNLSFTVGYEYDPEAQTDFLWDFLRKILPQPHLLDYMLKRLSDCLDGSIPNTIFLIITGDGANGKSQLFNLMEAALGEGYARKIANTVLTRKRENANDTNSEMIDMKGKRFIFFSEPESGGKFNISCLKDLTGSEKIKATAKYEGSSSFNIDAKMFIGCNEIPELKAEDKATWRRVRVMEFKSNFVDEPDLTIPNQYPRDPTIPDKIREDVTWRKALMKILIQYYYRTDIVEPEEVRKQTEAVREDNNEIEAWCHENIERDPEFEMKQSTTPKSHSHWLTKEEVKRVLSLKKMKDVDHIMVPFIQRFMIGINPVYKKHNFNTPSGERKNGFNCWLGIRLKKTEYV